jgi:hypothetical protein
MRYHLAYAALALAIVVTFTVAADGEDQVLPEDGFLPSKLAAAIRRTTAARHANQMTTMKPLPILDINTALSVPGAKEEARDHVFDKVPDQTNDETSGHLDKIVTDTKAIRAGREANTLKQPVPVPKPKIHYEAVPSLPLNDMKPGNLDRAKGQIEAKLKALNTVVTSAGDTDHKALSAEGASMQKGIENTKDALTKPNDQAVTATSVKHRINTAQRMLRDVRSETSHTLSAVNQHVAALKPITAARQAEAQASVTQAHVHEIFHVNRKFNAVAKVAEGVPGKTFNKLEKGQLIKQNQHAVTTTKTDVHERAEKISAILQAKKKEIASSYHHVVDEDQKDGKELAKSLEDEIEDVNDKIKDAKEQYVELGNKAIEKARKKALEIQHKIAAGKYVGQFDNQVRIAKEKLLKKEAEKNYKENRKKYELKTKELKEKFEAAIAKARHDERVKLLKELLNKEEDTKIGAMQSKAWWLDHTAVGVAHDKVLDLLHVKKMSSVLTPLAKDLAERKWEHLTRSQTLSKEADLILGINGAEDGEGDAIHEYNEKMQESQRVAEAREMKQKSYAMEAKRLHADSMAAGLEANSVGHHKASTLQEQASKAIAGLHAAENDIYNDECRRTDECLGEDHRCHQVSAEGPYFSKDLVTCTDDKPDNDHPDLVMEGDYDHSNDTD